MRKIIALAAFVVAVSGAAPARAQWTVVDPVNHVDQLIHQVQFVKTVYQLLQIYEQTKQQYELARMMAQNVKDMPSRFPRTVMSQVYLLNPSRACISCGSWAAAANTGGDPGSTFGGVTTTLQDTSQLLRNMSPEAQTMLQARLAHSVFLPDAAARSDLGALAQARGNDPQLQRYVAQCRALAADGTLNSQVQVTQAAGACSSVLAQQGTSTNALLGRLVEDQAIRKAKEVDQETQRINTEVTHAEAVQDVPRRTAGMDAAMRQMEQDLVR